MEGTMLWFNPAKRHGFIRTEGENACESMTMDSLQVSCRATAVGARG